MNTIHFQKLSDIPAPSDGYSLVTKSVANDGSLVFLSTGRADWGAVKERNPKPFRLSLKRPDGSLQTIELPELDVTFSLVDIFPDGKLLIVGPRCDLRGKDDDLNGVVFDPKSGMVSRIHLGDGIGRAYVDALGRIWVSYFDEGVFGGGIGAAGLVCFSEAGEKLWALHDDQMADCYALNVSNAEAAIFFYTEFPICRISSDFKLTRWETTLAGCHEFAISDTEVLFSGQYKDPADAAYLGRFQADGTLTTQRIQLLLPDGSPVPKGQLLGRGKHLYFFDASSVYRASLD